MEAVLNQILEAQVSEALAADRHERSEEREGYRNGHRVRTLWTRRWGRCRCKCRRRGRGRSRRNSSSATSAVSSRL
ncbi:transposase [Accumulibacter sp.]|uniref:transposase n=1 Tax=Accumulibacter sp. TaxID=2053492 RepID=UPI0025FC2617|nr:transposase [Accumulibacter sp.]MCM8626869.1 transposase [Accumulibacter sp.]